MEQENIIQKQLDEITQQEEIILKYVEQITQNHFQQNSAQPPKKKRTFKINYFRVLRVSMAGFVIFIAVSGIMILKDSVKNIAYSKKDNNAHHTVFTKKEPVKTATSPTLKQDPKLQKLLKEAKLTAGRIDPFIPVIEETPVALATNYSEIIPLPPDIPSPTPTPVPTKVIKLVGIMKGENNIALLEINDGSKVEYQQASEGEYVDGKIINKIDENKIILQNKEILIGIN